MAKRVGYRREPQEEDRYVVGEWNGWPHFQCRLCAFDTLRADMMMAHLGSHADQEARDESGRQQAGEDPAQSEEV